VPGIYPREDGGVTRQETSRRDDADAILLECCVLRHLRSAGRSSRCAIAAAVVDLFIWQRQAGSSTSSSTQLRRVINYQHSER